MDDATLAALREALTATPDNDPLRVVVFRALVARGEPRQAADLLQGRELRLGDDDRRQLAQLWLGLDEPQRALDLVPGTDAASFMLRARALVALGRHEHALAAYNEALGKNAALEDLDLKARITARVSTPAAQRPGTVVPLRVLATDDTSGDEVKRLLQPEQQKVTFADVGGHDDIKRQIEKRIITPFLKPSLFERFKKRVGGGILMYGPPGCGKTLLARATAGQCDAQFFNVAISDVLDMYIGESERKLAAIFAKARSSTPAVLFFDELEGLAAKRSYARESSSAKVVSQFLTEMDGFAQNNKGVLILGATNVPWAVDPAFRRPGRFDRVLFVPPPDRSARAAILRILLTGRPIKGEIDHDWLAERTSGFSGADLENLVEEAADAAIEDSLAASDEVPITGEHLRHALKQVKATTLEWLTTARNHARYSNEGGQYDEVLQFLDRNAKR
ncbi:MAG TPA: AAA family ATPase [Nannocystis sp.]|jgi:SpoVK/Ycf46/Vps4 family AAA+-type ATPase